MRRASTDHLSMPLLLGQTLPAEGTGHQSGTQKAVPSTSQILLCGWLQLPLQQLPLSLALYALPEKHGVNSMSKGKD